MVLLYSEKPDGAAFIDTMDLDGETNLKRRQAHPLTARHFSLTEKAVSHLKDNFNLRCVNPLS